VSGPAGI